MQKNWQEFQNYRLKFKVIVRLFYLDLLFIILTFLSFSIDFPYSKPITILLICIDILHLLGTVFHIKKNHTLINEMEKLFLRDHNGEMSYKLCNFKKLIEYNLFQYHFQPIVNARNGEIFAYEAFMRTDPDTIDLMPLEILNLATKEDCLYSVERYTFYNILRIMKEKEEFFLNKKLFINSISSHQLTNTDFEELHHNYSFLFRNVVMEITETTMLSEEGLNLISKRLKDTSCQLALDDYGTGCSNESNLLTTNPNYIKIDGSILCNIHIDSKKQHIVSGLINFAAQNNIKVIAEGIETYEEFEYVIRLGVDYIQGYYTARPTPELLPKVSQEVIDKIQEINRKVLIEGTIIKLYETKGDTIVYPVALALDMYSDLLIREREISVRGSQEMIANLSLIIPDNHDCQITLEQVRLRGNDKPAIILGKNCSVVLNLIGSNDILNDGIRVPETSDLTINGDGNLTIQAEHTNRVGIGGTALQAYGNITLASTGNIKVISNGNISVAIGGGQNPYNSQIHILSGTIYIDSSGYNTVGIGSISGNAKVKISNAKIKITAEGTKATGIGSLRGYVDLLSSGNLIIKCSGKNAVGIGSIEDSDGKIMITDGIISIRFNSHCGSGIGALGGKLGIDILNGDLTIFGEGTDLSGIGDHDGFGDIRIKNGTISVQLYASNAIPIGNVRRNVIIDGGNIQCDFPEEIIPVNTYGTPLVARIIMDLDEFHQTVDAVKYSYEYQASYSDRYPYIKVYLPENIII